jgi:dTDP-4-amino-4,6-dideoxygalactose transaminase
MDPLLTLAQRHRLTLIEDAAQAHGAKYRDHRVGGLGDLGCFSFYPGKNLGAYGEGGIVVTNDADHARTIRSLRSWGEDRRYQHIRPGFNYRMDGIQGAILRVKLRHLPVWNDARRRIATAYDQALADTGVTTPTVMAYAHHVFHLYAVQTAHRDFLHQALDAEGIQSGLHYPVPVHLQPAHADLGGQRGDHPCAETAAAETLTLPIYPELPEEVPSRVAEIIRRTLPG